MDMTKEEFIYFSRRASDNPNSDEGICLYNFLVRCFTDADIDFSGAVTFDEFDKMIENAAALPRKYGFAPKTEVMFKNNDECKKSRKTLFDSIDSKKSGRISLEAWIAYAQSHIFKKVHELKPHILQDGPKDEFIAFTKKAVVKGSTEFKELYFYLLKVFQDADTNHDGGVSPEEFDQMIESAAAMPRRYGLAPKTSDLYKTDAARIEGRKKLFADIDTNNDGSISFDEWLNYAVKHITGKVASL
ncbi:uncharacterized protein LOC141911307 [Tubulanus polymorphus]|uniref:uncharacterized protein LOC141911307 n=1 Tax=Tubulanus polymorphus TaxID=672921 RepID=UPI003DA24947